MNHWAALGVGCGFTFLVLAVEHWYPYTRPLRLVERYVAGVFAIWAGFALYRGLLGDIWMPLALLAICGAGGVSVVGGYWLDEHQRRVLQAEAAERHDGELTK